MRIVRVLALCGTCAIGAIAHAAHAEIRPAVQGIACVPGGVAAVPLVRAAGDTWPATVPVRVGDLTTQGVVVWLSARDDGRRYWTRSPDQVEVRVIGEAPQDAPPEQTGAVLALIELPSVSGEVAVLGTKLDVNWLARAPIPMSGAASMPWPSEPTPDLPDTSTPSEYWRWCLLAQRRGQLPPPPVGSMPEKLWARHGAGLWLAGLERVRQSSAGTHAELVEALTSTARDPLLPPPGEVAAWLARPDDLRALLSVLLDSSTRNEQLAQSALSWLRSHWTVTMWVESDAGDRVSIAAVNGGAGELVLKLTWVGVPDATPVAMLLPPRTVVRQWIDRSPLPASEEVIPIERLRGERIQVMLGDLRKQLDVGAREYPAKPPGLSFGTFVPPLLLADAQSGRIVPLPASWRTTASLRRRQSKWEVLVECMRPAEVDPLRPVFDEHADEVALDIGDPESPMRTVRVTAAGRFSVEGGSDDGAAAGFMRWSDRWRARIELPDGWFPASTAGVYGLAAARPAMIGLQRTPGSDLPRQTGALALPPWAPHAPAVLIDLGAWTDPATR